MDLWDDLIGGSDVANITTTARRHGDYYLVNGAKKWITNGIWADFCTTAVRTGRSGRNGISLLVVPLRIKGVRTRRMENSGVNASGECKGILMLVYSVWFCSALSFPL